MVVAERDVWEMAEAGTKLEVRGTSGLRKKD